MTKCNLLREYDQRLNDFDRNPAEWLADGITRKDLDDRRQAIAEIVETLTESECHILVDLRSCSRDLAFRIARITSAFRAANNELSRFQYDCSLRGMSLKDKYELNVFAGSHGRSADSDPLPPAA